MAQVNPLWRDIVVTAADDKQRMAQSVLDWWHLAGVSWDYADMPNDWLADDLPAPAPVSARATPATQIAPVQQPAVQDAAPPASHITLPDDLESFQATWRAGALGPDGGNGAHIAPSGTAKPRIMVITGAPEEDDRDTVMSGRVGSLLDNIARATGTPPGQLYRASFFPRVVLDGRAASHYVESWRRLTLHHIALVEPEMLVVAGGETARALLGHDPSQKPPALHFLNHGDRTIKTVVLRKLSLMLERIAPEKSMAWQNWQLLLVE